MRITVGVLAYNEERNISRTLQSLFAQSVFTTRKAEHAVSEWAILVVPNGCSDRTHQVAEETLTKLVQSRDLGNVRIAVESLSVPGKSNAWDELIHRIAPYDSDAFVMLDSDIEFGHEDTVHNCLALLKSNDHLHVVVDLPIKDFTRKERLTLFERISAAASKVDPNARPGISGQFYCLRGATAREIWMPVGLSVEDGFLNAMVATNCFRTEPDYSRVARAADASHYFEGLSSPAKLIKHEVRIAIGTVLNCFLCWDALLFTTSKVGAGAGELVRTLNQQQPDWYRRMMMNQIRGRGLWVVPCSFLIRRFEGSTRQGPIVFLRRLPFRLVATVFDAIVYFKANRRLRSESAIGFW